MLFIQAKPKDRRVYLTKEEGFINQRKAIIKWDETYFDVSVIRNQTVTNWYDDIKVVDTKHILEIKPDPKQYFRYTITGKRLGTTEVIVSLAEAGESKSDSFIFEVRE